MSTAAAASPDTPNASSRLPSREQVISAITGEPLDLLVIGGGIVGAGIIRDAALRGLRVGLVEQKDFASGTSSRSSRLLHGGMRYLAQGRLKLVRESSVEKKVVHKIAPHLAMPLPFIFPAYAGNRDWVLWQLKIGVKIYDFLCSGKNFDRSQSLTPDETLKLTPLLDPNGLKGAVRYYDGFTNDSRLVLDTLRSAQRAGGMMLNYCAFTAAQKREFWDCDVKDVAAENNFRVRARTVVNATGPWAASLPHSQVKLRLTKGVHIVVQRSRVPVTDTIVMTDRRRILFAIPWGERTIIGTTDTDYSGPLVHVLAATEEVRYLLDIANRYFPNIRLTEPDVISTWAGLRPLIADAHGRPSDISRAHEILSPEPGWWDIAGGKLTTYRLMAQQTIDKIVRFLTASNSLATHPRPCQTADQPLLPPSETQGISAIVPPNITRNLVEHFCLREWALHVEDIMLRRTSWHVYEPAAATIANRVADWMAEFLGWSATRRAEELERYHRATDWKSACRN